MKSFIIRPNKKKILNVLGILFIFFVWFILSAYFDNSLIIPKIFDVFNAFIQMFSETRIYMLVFKLVMNIILTISASFIVGLVIAILSYKYEEFYNFVSPIMTLLKTIPIIAIIILLLIAVMSLAPYVASSLVIIPIIFEGIYITLKQIDKNVTDDIKTISGFNLTVIIKFYIPLIFPNIITSLIQSFGLGLKVMVMAEYTSPKNNTFGAEIKRLYDNNNMEKVYALVLLLIILSFVVDKILGIVREKNMIT